MEFWENYFEIINKQTGRKACDPLRPFQFRETRPKTQIIRFTDSIKTRYTHFSYVIVYETVAHVFVSVRC